MPEISPKYASPNVRWALLLEDHPGAVYKFRPGKASEFEVPDAWGADEDVVVCTITFPDPSGLEPVTAYKEVTDSKGNNIPSDKRNVALFNSLSTKALGRACKRAGYPDDLDELKALILWRQRKAEVHAIGSGAPIAALPPGQVEAALDQVAVPAPDAVRHDAEPDDGDDALAGPTPTAGQSPVNADGEILDYEAALTEYRQVISTLGKKQAGFRAWMKDQHIDFVKPGTDQVGFALAKAHDVAADIEDAVLVGEGA